MEERRECPLCEQDMPQSLLGKHIESEKKDIRSFVMNQIKKAHPKWVEKDGACPKCWEYYRDL